MQQHIVKIKIIILLLVCIIFLFIPGYYSDSARAIFATCFASFILGFIFPALWKEFSFYKHHLFIKPNWNDPLKFKKPLSIIHLTGWIFICAGAGGLFRDLYYWEWGNLFTFTLIAAGVGIFPGIIIVLRIKKDV